MNISTYNTTILCDLVNGKHSVLLRQRSRVRIGALKPGRAHCDCVYSNVVTNPRLEIGKQPFLSTVSMDLSSQTTYIKLLMFLSCSCSGGCCGQVESKLYTRIQ